MKHSLIDTVNSLKEGAVIKITGDAPVGGKAPGNNPALLSDKDPASIDPRGNKTLLVTDLVPHSDLVGIEEIGDNAGFVERHGKVHTKYHMSVSGLAERLANVQGFEIQQS